MTNQAPTRPRLETIDFGRYPMWRTVLPGLIATLVGFGTPLVFFVVFLIRDLRSDTPHENVLQQVSRRFGAELTALLREKLSLSW